METTHEPRKDRKMTWDWSPGVSVGVFVFGKKLPENAEISIRLISEKDDHEDEPWETFIVGENAAMVYVEDGVIESVECLDSIRLYGFEMIGSHIDELSLRFDLQLKLDDRHANGSESWVSSSEMMTCWVEHGIVQSVSVGMNVSEESL